MLYHLSTQKGLTKLTPKIPECAVPMFENTNIKRVCFSDFIGGCLSALQDLPRKYYVYTPCSDIIVYKPSVDEVRDAKYTHEFWSLQPVKIKCIGIIQSENYIKTEQHNTGRGRTTFFHYPYHWVEKYINI